MFFFTGLFHLIACLILCDRSGKLKDSIAAPPDDVTKQRRALFIVTFSGLLHAGLLSPIAFARDLPKATNWEAVTSSTIPSLAAILPLLPLCGLHPRVRAKHKLMVLLAYGGAFFTVGSLAALMWVLVQIF